jgi:hypothetical protein
VERLELPPPEERRRASVMLDVMEVREENEEKRVRRGKENEKTRVRRGKENEEMGRELGGGKRMRR